MFFFGWVYSIWTFNCVFLETLSPWVHKYFTTSWIEQPKKCRGLKPARAGKDANRKQTNDRNSGAVHIVWALKRSWENVSRVTRIWRMSFVTGSLWPRLSTSLSFNDTSKHTNKKIKTKNTHIDAPRASFVCTNAHLERTTHRVTCPSSTVA